MPKIQAPPRAFNALLKSVAAVLLLATGRASMPATNTTLFLDRESSPVVDSLPTNSLALPPDTQPRRERYTVRREDSIIGLYSRFGGNIHEFPHAEIVQHRPVLRVGTVVSIERAESDGTLLAFHIPLNPREELSLRRDQSRMFRALKATRPYEEIERVVSGTVAQSFFASARSEGVPVEIIDAAVDALSAKLEFQSELKPGAIFKLLFTERRDPHGDLLEAGPLHAAVFENGERILTAVRAPLAGSGSAYLDEDGHPLDSGFLRYPVQFTRISSLYSKARFHPIYKQKRPHNGVDFAAPIGTPVRAAADGVVSVAARRGAAGLMIKLDHGSRYATAYLHLHTIAKGVRPGERVSRGQVIGTVGMSGSATGPHLHYELYENGQFVNPLTTPLVLHNDAVRPKRLHVKTTLARLTQGLTMLASATKDERDLA